MVSWSGPSLPSFLFNSLFLCFLAPMVFKASRQAPNRGVPPATTFRSMASPRAGRRRQGVRADATRAEGDARGKKKQASATCARRGKGESRAREGRGVSGDRKIARAGRKSRAYRVYSRAQGPCSVNRQRKETSGEREERARPLAAPIDRGGKRGEGEERRAAGPCARTWNSAAARIHGLLLRPSTARLHGLQLHPSAD